jgi:hypothetical protein
MLQILLPAVLMAVAGFALLRVAISRSSFALAAVSVLAFVAVGAFLAVATLVALGVGIYPAQ